MASSNGWSAKKPRLDKEPAKNVVDDLWGEDLSLDAVEECVFQASQFYPELKRSETVCSQALPGPSQYFNNFQPAHNSTAIPSTSKHHENYVSKETQDKLEAEIKKLKDDLQGKVGEISYLRNQKKIDESIWNNQLLEKTKVHTERIRALERESSLAKTTMEMMRVDLWKATEKAPIAQSAPGTAVATDECIGVVHVEDADGELLEDVLSPHFFERSEPADFDSKSSGSSDLMEACWRPVQRLCMEESFASRRALPHICSVIEACRAVISALVSTLQAGASAETLEDLQRRDRDLVECSDPTPAPDRLRPLSGRLWFDGEHGIDARRALATLAAVCQLSQRAAEITLSTHGLPRNRKTASMEREKSDLSVYVTCLSKISPEGAEPHLQNRPNNNDKAGPSRENEPIDYAEEAHSQEGGPMTIKWEGCGLNDKPLGLLPLLCELARVVSTRRHALAYGGVLTAICTLIADAAGRTDLPLDSVPLVAETLRWVVLSRPRVLALPALLSALAAFSWSSALSETLCRPATAGACTLREDGVAVFAHNICLIEMLCWLAEQRDSSVDNRARMCKALFDWVWYSVKQRPCGPAWSRAKSAAEPPDECRCRARLAELCVRSAHRTLIDFEAHFEGLLGEILRRTLVRGMMLLHFLTDTDPDFGRHMLHAEGSYQLLLIGLRETTHDLRLDQYEDEALRELLAMEEDIKPGHFEVTEDATRDLGRLFKSLQRLCQQGT